MLTVLIDGSISIVAHKGVNLNYWDARDWIEDVEEAVPQQNSFKVGWPKDENWQCGMVRNG